jgi:hypothetical protein
MINRIVCPQGHEVAVAPDKLGQTVICPHCLTPFLAELDLSPACHARKDGKASKASDDDDDDDDVDDRIQAKLPPKKSSPAKSKKQDDDEVEVHVQEKLPAKKAIAKKNKDADDEEDGPPVKKAARRKGDEDEEEDKPSRARDDDDAGKDEDDGEPRRARVEFEDDEEEPPIEWTRKKRQLRVVNIGLLAYAVSVVIMIVMFVLWALMSVLLMISLVIALIAEDIWFPKVVMVITLIMMSILFVPVYICHIVGWITGLFSPPRAAARSVVITAISLFLSPILLYLVWILFHFAIIDRSDVSDNMLNMMHFFSFLLIKLGFYTSLVYIGRIAAFMRMSDDRKPQALGWIVVGGSIILTILIVMFPFIILFGFWGLLGGLLLIVFSYYVFYLVISSLRELLEVVAKTRAGIVKFIEGR